MSNPAAQIISTRPRTRAPRRAYRRPIGVMVRGQYEICASLVLSENGILFAFSSGKIVEMGTVLVCSLVMPGGVSLILIANVVYQKKVNGQIQIGAGFLNIDIVGRRKIRSFVAAKTVEEARFETLDGPDTVPPTANPQRLNYRS